MKKEPEIRGKLLLKENFCTDPIKIHPIQSGTWFLIPPDLNESQKMHQYDYTTLIHFDGRQIWEVYYFNFGDDGGWVVQKNGLYLRMPEKDFEKYFGRYEFVKEK